MNLKEYLKEKLAINDDEAEKIALVLEEYKKQYGHHHHHHGENGGKDEKDIYSMIKEDEEFVTKSNFELSKIHCNGCHNECSLNEPKCGRGITLQNRFAKSENKE